VNECKDKAIKLKDDQKVIQAGSYSKHIFQENPFLNSSVTSNSRTHQFGEILMIRCRIKISRLVTSLMQLGPRALNTANAPILKNVKSLACAIQIPIAVLVARTTNLLAHFRETSRILFILIDVTTVEDSNSPLERTACILYPQTPAPPPQNLLTGI